MPVYITDAISVSSSDSNREDSDEENSDEEKLLIECLKWFILIYYEKKLSCLMQFKWFQLNT